MLRAAPLAGLAVLLYTALAVAFSWIQEMHNADSLLMALISLDRWTPFYWGEDRYGMLVPLLTSWIGDYRLNLLAQNTVLTLAPFAALFLFHGWFLPRDEDSGFTAENVGASVFAVLLALLLLRPTGQMVHVWLLAHPYFLSLALLLGGLALALRSTGNAAARWAGAAVLIAAGMWVNITQAPLAMALAAAVPLRGRSYRGSLLPRTVLLLMIAAAALAVYFIAQGYRGTAPYLAPIPPAELPGALAALLRDAATTVVRPWPLLACLLLAGLLEALHRHGVRQPEWITLGCFLLLSVGLAAAAALSSWVKLNGFSARYWTTPVALLLLVATGLVAARLVEIVNFAVRGTAGACVIGSILLLAATTFVFASPSLELARQRIDRASLAYSFEEQRLGCTHFLGDYWIAWPMVFHDRVHDPATPLWAVTGRSEVTRPLWDAVPAAARRYCGLCASPVTEFYRRQFNLPELQKVREDASMCEFRAAP